MEVPSPVPRIPSPKEVAERLRAQARAFTAAGHVHGPAAATTFADAEDAGVTTVGGMAFRGREARCMACGEWFAPDAIVSHVLQALKDEWGPREGGRRLWGAHHQTCDRMALALAGWPEMYRVDGALPPRVPTVADCLEAEESLRVDARQQERFAAAPQGSDTWKALRVDCASASVASYFVSPNPGARAETQRAMLYADTTANFAMRHGSRMEATNEAAWVALERAEAREAGRKVEVFVLGEGTLRSLDVPFMSASSDGTAFLTYPEEGRFDVFNAENKCPVRQGGYWGSVPFAHYAQQQVQMWVYEARLPLLVERYGRGSLVDGWTWRSKYSVYQDGAVLHRSTVPYDPDFMAHFIQAVAFTWRAEYAGRKVLRDAGVLTAPATVWCADVELPPLPPPPPSPASSGSGGGGVSGSGGVSGDPGEAAHVALASLDADSDSDSGDDNPAGAGSGAGASGTGSGFVSSFGTGRGTGSMARGIDEAHGYARDMLGKESGMSSAWLWGADGGMAYEP